MSVPIIYQDIVAIRITLSERSEDSEPEPDDVVVYGNTLDDLDRDRRM